MRVGPPPLPRPLDRRADDGIDRLHIVAVHDDARDAVATARRGDVGDLHLVGHRCRVGVTVVLDEADPGRVVDRGQVEGLVEQPHAAPAVAGEGQGHTRLAAVAEAHRRAQAHRQGVGQVADEAEDPEAQVADAVDVDVAARGDARGAAQQVGEDAPRGEAAQQEGAQVAVHRRHHIVRPQRVARADADRLMAALAEGAAHPAALFPMGDHALIEGAGEPHPIVEVEPLRVGQVLRHRHSLSGVRQIIHAALPAAKCGSCTCRKWRYGA